MGNSPAKEDRLPDDVLLKEQISMRLCTSGYQNIVQCRENNNKKKLISNLEIFFFQFLLEKNRKD